MVRVPDVMVMGRRRLPWSGHCRTEVKEFTVVAAGYDVPGAQLDDAELMVDIDVEGVEGTLMVWWRQWMWRCCHGGSVSRRRQGGASKLGKARWQRHGVPSWW
jgi:hypothetical protein